MIYRRNCHDIFVTVPIEIARLEEHRVLAIGRDSILVGTWNQFRTESAPIEVGVTCAVSGFARSVVQELIVPIASQVDHLTAGKGGLRFSDDPTPMEGVRVCIESEPVTIAKKVFAAIAVDVADIGIGVRIRLEYVQRSRHKRAAINVLVQCDRSRVQANYFTENIKIAVVIEIREENLTWVGCPSPASSPAAKR